jgi:uncharacterized protein YbaA (DUF1428 family)
MTYVDGFVVAVPAANREAYIAYAQKAAPFFKEAGVLRFVECWGDDVPEGKVTDFRRAVQATPEEQVVFAWLEWPSKEARDAGMAKIMADDRMRDMPMPFDGKRMIFGGFRPVIDV